MNKLLVLLVILPASLLSQNIMFIKNIQSHILDTVSLNLSIDNSGQFVAFQTDIKIPEGFTYINNSATLTSRANGHILSANLLPANILRVLAFAINQNYFNGDSGAVMKFELILGDSAGVFPIELVNPIISNANSQNILTSFINGELTIIDTIVPVKMTTFYGSKTKKFIQLFWTTATELNNKGFYIERQLGYLGWETIGFVAGKGISQITEYYSFFDNVSSYQMMNVISYRLKQVDYDGSYQYYDSISFTAEKTTEDYILFTNYPNPFNPSTVIGVYLRKYAEVEFLITDINGSVIKKEIKNIPQGYSEIIWDGKNSESIPVPAGVYFYSIQTQDFIKANKMILLR